MLTTKFHQHKLKDALISIPTTVNVVPIHEFPLITPTELAPVDVCSNLLQAVYISVAFHDI